MQEISVARIANCTLLIEKEGSTQTMENEQNTQEQQNTGNQQNGNEQNAQLIIQDWT